MLKSWIAKFPDGIYTITDSAKYMLKAGRDLSVFYPHMVHVTCIARALHRVCETIRLKFPQVDDFISSTKKVPIIKFSIF